MIKVSIDRYADVLYIEWGEGGGGGRELMPGIILRINADGQPVGLEVIDLSRRTSASLDKLLLSYCPTSSSLQEAPPAQDIVIEFPVTVPT